jgi:hypothetical protein
MSETFTVQRNWGDIGIKFLNGIMDGLYEFGGKLGAAPLPALYKTLLVGVNALPARIDSPQHRIEIEWPRPSTDLLQRGIANSL